jgi:hypothetical protein
MHLTNRSGKLGRDAALRRPGPGKAVQNDGIRDFLMRRFGRCGQRSALSLPLFVNNIIPKITKQFLKMENEGVVWAKTVRAVIAPWR